MKSYFAARLFFEFLRSLSPGGECLIELKQWRFWLVSEIEFLDEFSRLTRTMHWTLRSMHSVHVAENCLADASPFCRMSVAFGMSQTLFFFHWYGYPNTFLYERTIFFGRMTDFSFRCSMTNTLYCSTIMVNNSCATLGSALLILQLWTCTWCGPVQVR